MAVQHIDFARRAHQTVRDRKRLRGTSTFLESDLQRRTLRTEFVGGFVLGFLWGAGLLFFFWLLNLWVTVGGTP